MSKVTKRVVIVGGGSAGWITAGVIAAEHKANSPEGIEVILIESPDVNIVGVGEGTWPTMRKTMKKLGVSENDLFKECDASFKQGAKFAKWVTGAADDFYYHPFVLPHGYLETDLVIPWQTSQSKIPFADVVSFQGEICEQGLAPKQISTPEYAAVANYAYHLDAVKLGKFLRKHCIDKLGVQHIIDHVSEVNSCANKDIASVLTNEHGSIKGDLFIDCTGQASLLLGQHYKIPFICKKDILFNDSALAVHVPYPDKDSPIAPYTQSTAQSSGWIWDIGLPTRRGVGYTYSSKYISHADAEIELKKYIEESTTNDIANSLKVKKIDIKPGHREIFWHKNCVAVGISSGLLEPLEASALVLVELAAEKISNELPATREVMDIVAKRYNKQFLYRWNRIIEFLKLHYILTKRTDSNYWIDNCKKETIPDSLLEMLALWRHHPPCPDDFIHINEVFPSASWQYILYGMGFDTQARTTSRKSVNSETAHRFFSENKAITKKYMRALPSNRDLINKIKQYGMQKV
jgi:hypothetical protein